MDYLEIQKEIRRQFAQAVRETFAVEVAELALGIPPSLDLGEVSIAACFELAKMLRRPPRKPSLTCWCSAATLLTGPRRCRCCTASFDP